MKNLFKVLFAFVAISLAITSCTKESQKCINKLEGSWDISSFEITDSSGTTTDMASIVTAFGGTFTGTMEFEKYDRKSEDYGTGNQSIVIDFMGTTENINTTFQYALSEDCSSMTLTDQTTNESQQMSISEISADSYELSGSSDNEAFKIQIDRN